MFRFDPIALSRLGDVMSKFDSIDTRGISHDEGLRRIIERMVSKIDKGGSEWKISRDQ